MKFGAFKEQNLLLGKGDNPNTIDMPACLCVDPSTKQPFIVGRLDLTDEEIEAIKESKHLYIGVMGTNWPPLMVTKDNPFKDWGNESFLPLDFTRRK